jgi:glycosyltransferase involved in cell wall biosynthesis
VKKPKLLFFFTNKSSFVKKDIQILEKEYDVNTFLFKPAYKIFTPFDFIFQLFFLIKEIYNCKRIICQFGGYHSLVPAITGKIFNIPCLIIAGGVDCVSLPLIGYGNFNKPLLGFFTKWSFKLANHISPKHHTLINYEYQYENVGQEFQGIQHFCKGIKTPMTVIVNGYDSTKWQKISNKKKDTFLTVTSGLNYPFQSALKGIDLIIEVAPHFPHCKFTIIGVEDPKQLPIKSKNILLLPPVTHEELINFYSENEYYLQLSMAEGFPNALCEAMLCGCIPVGSNVFGIPFIINDTGFILPKRDDQMLVELLKKGMNSDKEQLSLAARKRIMDNFPIARREKELITLVSKLTGK